MGPKIQNPGPRSEQSESESSTSSSHTVQSVPSDFSTIKLECERALNALENGNHTEALRLMKELCSKDESSAYSALIHRVQGTVCFKVASIIGDPIEKQEHLKNAVESAQKAVEKSPSSIEYAHFYANLLYEAANDGAEYEQVVKECKRALNIVNPIDPATESLNDESQQEIPTAEARIDHVQNELWRLARKAISASLSTWARNRDVPNPKEERLDQTGRSNEAKKATRKSEVKGKEHEVQVAKRDDRTFASSSGSGQRGSEREKYGHAQEAGSTCERDLGLIFWNSMSLDSKKQLLRIKVRDLIAYFKSPKSKGLKDLVVEAWSYAEANQTWKCSLCCHCSAKFPESEPHTQHVMQEHVGNLSPELQKILPQNADSEWIEKILKCSWKPLDASAALKMLENQAKCSNDCKSEETSTTEGVEVEGSITYSPADGWPLSDDSERAKLLEKIQEIFDRLITHKNLAASHLNKVIQFTMDEIQGLAAGPQLLNHGFDQSPACICFLEAPQLKIIFKFLLQLSHACGLGINADKITSPMDDSHNSNQILEIKEEIVVNGAESCLLLDECLIPAEITSGAAKSTAMDGVITPTSDDEDLLNTDPFLSWIFSGPSHADHFASCLRAKDDKICQGMELVQTLVNEFYLLRTLSEEKSERMYYEEASQVVEENLFGELTKIDARIMKSITKMQQLELKLELVSAFDYRAILLPLVRFYLKALLEDLAMKEAMKEYDASTEAILAELADDPKKGVKGGRSDSAKHTKKTKNKKNRKQKRKTKDSKARHGHDPIPEEEEQLEEEEEEKKPEEDLESQRRLEEEKLEKALELQKRFEEEARLQIQINEDMKKLEEVLEFRRRFEEEARLKVQSKEKGKQLEEALESPRRLEEEARLKIQSEEEGKKPEEPSESQRKLEEEATLKTRSEEEEKQLEEASELQRQLEEEATFKTQSEEEEKQFEEQLDEEVSLKTQSEDEGKQLEEQLEEEISLKIQSEEEGKQLEEPLEEEARLKTKSEEEEKQLEEQLEEEARLKIQSEEEGKQLEEASESQRQLEEEARLKTQSEEEPKHLKETSESQRQLEEEAILKTQSEGEGKQLEEQSEEEVRLKTRSEGEGKQLEEQSEKEVSLKPQSEEEGKQLEEQSEEEVRLKTQSEEEEAKQKVLADQQKESSLEKPDDNVLDPQ